MPLNEEEREKYFKSGKILSEALKKTKDYVKPGKKVIDICNYAEEQILKSGAELAFPLNIGINEIAAHYTSPINDDTVIPEKCLVKLDLGANVDGYLSDKAITIAFGDENLEKFIIAAEAALTSGIKKIKAGVKVSEIGAIIEQTINKFNLKPIRNLSGHQMKQFNLHAGISVPNVGKSFEEDNYTFKEDDVFALEPFTTDGGGSVYSGTNTYIYALLKRKIKNIPSHLSNIIEEIWKSRNRLPFTFRWFKDIPNRFITQLLRMNVFYKYPVLLEIQNGKVAQAEHTIIVHNDSCTVLTE